MLCSLGLTYALSERYRAGTTIVYRPSRRVQIKQEFSTNQETALGFPLPTLPFEVIGKTIEEMGTGERVLRRVVQDLGLDRPEPIQGTGFGYQVRQIKESIKKYASQGWQILKHGRIIAVNPTSEAIMSLAKNTRIHTQKNYTARLSVSAKDPAKAALIVDHLAQALVDVMRELNTESARQHVESLDQRVAVKATELENARKAIDDLKNEHGFVSLDEETALHLNTAAKIQRDLLDNEGNLQGAMARLKTLISQRESLEMRVRTLETVDDDPVYIKLRGTLTDKEVLLRGLLNKLPEHHADVQALRAEIQMVGELLATMEARRVSSVTTALNAQYVSVQAEELRVGAEIRGLEADNASLADSLAKVKAEIDGPSVQSKLRELELQVKLHELGYGQLVTAREEARIAQIALITEIQVLHKATPQDAPFRPIKIYHVALSGFLALMIGLGLVYILDFLDSMWTSPAGETVSEKGI